MTLLQPPALENGTCSVSANHLHAWHLIEAPPALGGSGTYRQTTWYCSYCRQIEELTEDDRLRLHPQADGR